MGSTPTASTNYVMDYKNHLAEKMKDPDFKREYEALEPEFELLSSLLKIRF